MFTVSVNDTKNWVVDFNLNGTAKCTLMVGREEQTPQTCETCETPHVSQAANAAHAVQVREYQEKIRRLTVENAAWRVYAKQQVELEGQSLKRLAAIQMQELQEKLDAETELRMRLEKQFNSLVQVGAKRSLPNPDYSSPKRACVRM